MIHDGIIAYEAIYDALVKRIGPQMTLAITHLDRGSVDKSDPVSSIKFLLKPIPRMFGEIPTIQMVEEALSSHFVENYGKEILREIGLVEE